MIVMYASCAVSYIMLMIIIIAVTAALGRISIIIMIHIVIYTCLQRFIIVHELANSLRYRLGHHQTNLGIKHCWSLGHLRHLKPKSTNNNRHTKFAACNHYLSKHTQQGQMGIALGNDPSWAAAAFGHIAAGTCCGVGKQGGTA
jgi:hypothetical protein